MKFPTMLLAVIATVSTISPALATRVIDQSNLVDPSRGMLLGSAISRTRLPSQSVIGQAQTVTAAVTGILGAVDLQLFYYSQTTTNEPFSFRLYDGALVEGTGVLVGQIDVAVDAAPTDVQAQAGSLLRLELASFNYAVVPGQVFTLYSFISSSGPVNGRGPRLVYGYESGVFDQDGFPLLVGLDYARGYNAITNGNGSDLETRFDRGFRTFVDVNAATVPEPATWTLMIAGFGMAGATMRRRAIAG